MSASFGRVFVLLGLAACTADAAGSAASDSSNLEGAQRATVIVHYPAGFGHRITLRGSGEGLGWTTGRDTQYAEGDAWVLTLDLVAPVELKPLYDDTVWSEGPNYTVRPGQTLDVWPAFFHERGRLERRSRWHTDQLQDRDVVIYYPPSYDENWHERYPVVYMHDGQNLFDDGAAFGGTSWDVTGAMDRGFANASIHEAIVVGLDNTNARMWEYTPTRGGGAGGGGATYIKFLADEVKPVIDRELRTLPGRENTAIMGSSLGGLISSYAGLARPDAFGLVGAVSPSTWWDGTWIIGQVQWAPSVPYRVYVDSGDAGSSQDDKVNTSRLAQAYRDRGATLQYTVQQGASHNEYWWRQRLPGALGFLLGPR